MLNRRALSFPLATLFISSAFLIISCDVVGGKPNTSAPTANDRIALWEACDEREGQIDEWEKRKEREIEDEWIDGKRGTWQSAAKALRIEKEADAMRDELRDNCHVKADRGFRSEIPPTTEWEGQQQRMREQWERGPSPTPPR